MKPMLEKKFYDMNKAYNDHIAKLEHCIETIDKEKDDSIKMASTMKDELEARLKDGLVKIIGEKISQKTEQFEEEKEVFIKENLKILEENKSLRAEVKSVNKKRKGSVDK